MDEFGPIDDVNPAVAMDDEEVAGLLAEVGSSHDDGFKVVSHKIKPKNQPKNQPKHQPKPQPKPQPLAKPLSPLKTTVPLPPPPFPTLPCSP
jgi:hypothetical protein